MLAGSVASVEKRSRFEQTLALLFYLKEFPE